MGATVYTIAGGKGGVGKTTTAVNLGATLRAMGRVVGLIDTDLAMSDLQGLLGLSHEPTVHEVLGGTASLTDACVKHVADNDNAGRLDVYPGSTTLDDYGNADPNRLKEVVETLAEEYDSLILDTGTGLTHDTAIPMKIADKIIVVTTPAKVAVVDTRKTVHFAHRLGNTVDGAVISRTCRGLTDTEVSDIINVSRIATIPSFDATPEDILQAYRRLAVRLLDGADATVQEEPAMILTPVTISDTDTAGTDRDAPQPHDSRPLNEDSDSDQPPDADSTDDTEETESDDVPGWFTGMVD